MRKLGLAVAVIGLLALPAYGQFGFGGFGGGGQMSGNRLLLNQGVQKELKLSEEQTETLAEIQKESFGTFFKLFKEKDKDKRKEMQDKAAKKTEKQLDKIYSALSATQKKRLEEIDVQAGVRFTGVTVFTREKVAKKLKLTDTQKTAAEEASKDQAEDLKEIFSGLKFGGFGKKGKKGKGGGFEAFQKANEKATKLRTKMVDQFVAKLSDTQKTTWKEMQGDPFEFATGFGKKGKKKKEARKDDA